MANQHIRAMATTILGCAESVNEKQYKDERFMIRMIRKREVILEISSFWGVAIICVVSFLGVKNQLIFKTEIEFSVFVLFISKIMSTKNGAHLIFPVNVDGSNIENRLFIIFIFC